MRLKSLKLAGFKSFVDPIQVDFPGIMCGIVGPNGCGKSNIIDAVKWVKGELSPKSLRSESLQDVIFNGSDNRKPVSHCSVELSFDNSENFLGGEYLKFDEVSVKREMGRDGQSNYFINNASARRRDVQDLFLGTGLGSNSYAIIEQGIISSMVGAKPEELRSYVEEAAGITKYKERKRETESRMRRTAENISRLRDLEDEVKRSIRRLNAEANLATKYKKLRDEEQQYQKYIIRSELDELLQRKKLSEKENKDISSEIEKLEGDKLAVISKRDVAKVKLLEGLKSLEDQQRGFFETGAKISMIEEKAKSYNQRLERLDQEKNDVETSLSELRNPKSTEGHESDSLTEEANKFATSAISRLGLSLSEKETLNVHKELCAAFVRGYDLAQGEPAVEKQTIVNFEKQFSDRLSAINEEKQIIKTEQTSEESLSLIHI